MASGILERLREKVRTRDYVMTVHAEEEMDEDDLSIFDKVRCSRGRLSSDSVIDARVKGSALFGVDLLAVARSL